MRPKSIVIFERLSITALGIGILLTLVTWNENRAALEQAGASHAGMIAIQALAVAITLLLILLISRKASSIAKWILVALTVIGAVIMLFNLGAIATHGVYGALEILQLLLQAGALYFLFRPDAREWFARDPGAAASA